MQMEEVEVVKEEPLEPVESAVSVQEPMDNNWLWICGERPQPGANMDEWMPMPISHLYPDDVCFTGFVRTCANCLLAPFGSAFRRLCLHPRAHHGAGSLPSQARAVHR